jgi:hypothetical protein
MKYTKGLRACQRTCPALAVCIVGPMHVIRDGRSVLHPRDWRPKSETRNSGVNAQKVRLGGRSPIVARVGDRRGLHSTADGAGKDVEEPACVVYSEASSA